jgi:hypothetical protein
VDRLSPASGPTGGGTKVAITGDGLTGTTAVDFGTVAATSVTVDSATQITAVSPPEPAGSVDVTVKTSGGTSAAAAATGTFTYLTPTTTTTTTTTTTDTRPPTRPRLLSGRFAAGALLLRWRASTDNVRVTRYELYRNGAPLKRIVGTATRTTIVGFRARRRTVLTLRAFDAAGDRSTASNPLVIVRRRVPAGVPRPVPPWAAKLYAWETSGRHGRLPTTPAALPAWYAGWKAWIRDPYKITP